MLFASLRRFKIYKYSYFKQKSNFTLTKVYFNFIAQLSGFTHINITYDVKNKIPLKYTLVLGGGTAISFQDVWISQSQPLQRKDFFPWDVVAFFPYKLKNSGFFLIFMNR